MTRAWPPTAPRLRRSPQPILAFSGRKRTQSIGNIPGNGNKTTENSTETSFLMGGGDGDPGR